MIDRAVRNGAVSGVGIQRRTRVRGDVAVCLRPGTEPSVFLVTLLDGTSTNTHRFRAHAVS